MELDNNEINSTSSKSCPDCNKSYTDIFWCKECNAKQFRQNFSNWTSENNLIDKFIQKTQLNARNNNYLLEWISYNRFKIIESPEEYVFSTVYKAVWLDGPIEKWSYNERKWVRYNEDKINNISQQKGWKVVLKSINLDDEFLNKV